MRGLRENVVIAVLAIAAALLSNTALANHRPGNVILIGGSWSLTGRYALPAGRIYNGIELYVEELNARGGLLGHKVELRVLDDRSDRRTAISNYEKLITEDAVDLVLGPYSSGITDAVANVMERYKRPFLAPATSPVIWRRGRRYVFRVPLPIAQDFQKGALHLAKQLSISRIAIIGEGSPFPRQVTEGALEWAEKLGLQVALLQSYDKGSADFTTLLRRIEASGADAIFANTYHQDTFTLTRQLRGLDINVKLFSATLGPVSQEFADKLGSTAEFVVGFSSWEPRLVRNRPDVKAFIERYETRYGETPSYRPFLGYTTMQIYEAAVRRNGSFDSERVRDAMASITVQTIMGPWQVDEHGFMSTDGLAIQTRTVSASSCGPP